MEKNFNKILIIRPSAIGDIVMATPMIGVLRSAFPDAFIAWLVDAALKDLLIRDPRIDKVIEWPKARWKYLAKKGRYFDLTKETGRFIKRLRSYDFDLVIDAQGLLKSRLFARLSGAKTRLGLDSKEPGKFLMTEVLSQKRNDKRIGSEYRELTKTLGLHTQRFPMEIVVGSEDEAYSQKKLHEAGLHSQYAVFSPFTTRPQKHWLPERWLTLSKEIEKLYGLRSAVLGGNNDRKEGKKLAHGSRGRIIDLTGKTSLLESACIIKHAAILIGVDTGLTHMGIAFGRPTIALFGSTCPYLNTFQKNAIVIHNKFSCSPCRRKPICGQKFTCMESITVDQVIKTVERLIN
jgi:heptosyltransferase-1